MVVVMVVVVLLVLVKVVAVPVVVVAALVLPGGLPLARFGTVGQHPLDDGDQVVDPTGRMIGLGLQRVVASAKIRQFGERPVAIGGKALPVLAGGIEAARHRVDDGIDAGKRLIQAGQGGIGLILLVAHGFYGSLESCVRCRTGG